MKVLFAHDHVFYYRENSIYSEVDFGVAMWNRYLICFDKLIIAARISDDINIRKVDEMNKTPLNENIDIIKLKSISGIRNLKNRNEVYDKLKQGIQEVDYVIARLPSEIGLLSIKIAKRLNKPYLIELVGSPFDAYWHQGSNIGKLYAPIITLRVKEAVKKATHVIYVTKEYLQAKYPNKGHSTNCSNININVDYPYEVVRDSLNMDVSQEIIIGLNGSLSSSYKGIDTAIQTIKLLDNRYKLRILGAGPKTKWLNYAKKHGVEDRVYFDGTVPSGKPVLDWIDKLDIYIQPSKTEGLPRALIEAMSRGRICIGSNRGGIPELLEKKYIHKANDAKELKNIIQSSLDDKKERFRISERNYLEAKKYNSRIIEKRRQDFLQNFKESYIK